MTKASNIKHIIKKHFEFLCSDFEATIVQQESDSFGVFVTYTTEHAGMRISFEPREGGVFAMIFPLHEHQIPDYRDWYDIHDLFQAKGIEFTEHNITDTQHPDPLELEKALRYFAENIQVHATSFLRGDFTAIDDMKRIVANRISSWEQS